MPFLVAALTVAAFFPSLNNGFVNWDDDKTLLENQNYRGLGWAQLRWMFTTIYMGHYQPLSWVTLGLDYLVWGMQPWGYHLTNLVLHTVNAVLFYFIALRLLCLALSLSREDFSLRLGGVFAALLFAIHPLRVESVAWITERRDVLSGLFLLLTILCYLRSATVTKESSGHWPWLVAAVVAYGLSLLSKASGMTLPFVLLILDVYPLRRLGDGAQKWLGPAARKVWWEKLPFFLLALGAAVTALSAQYLFHATTAFERHGLESRLAQALFGLAFYLRKTLAPLGLSPLYELSLYHGPSDWRLLLSAILVLAVSVGLFVFRHRWPAGLATWACYVVIVAPVLGIAQSGPQIAADRYSYLSCLGWAILAGAGLIYLWRHWPDCGSRTFIAAIGAAAVIGLGVLTWRQAQVWHDSEKLWRHVLEVAEGSSLAHYNLADALLKRGELNESAKHFRRALQIKPGMVEARYNLGAVLEQQGRWEEALEHYRQALIIDPRHVDARNNLGVLLSEHGKSEDAVEQLGKAVQINPGYARPHNNLGNILVQQGRLDEAVEQYRQALQIDPANANGHVNLGVALAKQGKLSEAVQHYQQALRLQPEFAEAHENLSGVLAFQGKKDEAAQHHQEALRIKFRRETDTLR